MRGQGRNRRGALGEEKCAGCRAEGRGATFKSLTRPLSGRQRGSPTAASTKNRTLKNEGCSTRGIRNTGPQLVLTRTLKPGPTWNAALLAGFALLIGGYSRSGGVRELRFRRPRKPTRSRRGWVRQMCQRTLAASSRVKRLNERRMASFIQSTSWL